MEKLIATNKQAKRDYDIIETKEAGIALLGPEVKSLRQSKANMKDSFAKIENGEAFLYNLHISPYGYSSLKETDAKRVRRLLLHKEEISRLEARVKERGFTLIPLRIYFKSHIVKVELALARGKKLYDKREVIRERELKRELRRVMKHRR